METVAHCLMCAIRQLTEGRPKTWEPESDGDTVIGIVLRTGTQPSHFQGQVPFIDLWLGELDRVRVVGHAANLGQAIEAAEAKVGDRIVARFDGRRQVERGRLAGRSYRVFTVEVQRGHH